MTSDEDRQGVAAELQAVEELLEAWRRQDAQERVERVISGRPRQVLADCRSDIARTIGHFPDKRRRELEAFFLEALSREDPPSRTQRTTTVAVTDDEFKAKVRASLEELCNKYIFDWTGHYPTTILDTFEEGRAIYGLEGRNAAVVAVLAEELSTHSAAIFTRGRDFQHSKGLDERTIIAKSLGGLRSFLELIVNTYTSDVGQIADQKEARAIRAVCSSMIGGVVDGYSKTRFGTSAGRVLLANNYAIWVWALPFVRGDHVAQVSGMLPVSAAKTSLQRDFEPLCKALDSALMGGGNVWPLVVDARLEAAMNRLDLELAVRGEAGEAGSLQVECYLGQCPRSSLLRESVSQGVALVMCELDPDLQVEVNYDSKLSDVVVDTSEQQVAEAEATRMLKGAVGDASDSEEVVGNPARKFPIDRPARSAFFKVNRTAVRRLLQGFENRGGVHLWCSVRRSGKTTACLQLETTGDSRLVYQTCSSTDVESGPGLLYEELCRHIDRAKPLDRNFIESTAIRAAGIPEHDVRLMLVLDEYETAFERLRFALERSPELRYTIAQPFLNQLVSFSRENLVVLVGQRPDAYHIIAEQNQLIPCVVQDHFPLFEHDPVKQIDEYGSFLERVVRKSLLLDQRLVTALHLETGGHPYLTVNLLIEFIDWHLRLNSPKKGSALTLDHYRAFAPRGLSIRSIASSREYELFHSLCRQATSASARSGQPWLYCVISLLKWIHIQSPETMSVSFDDAEVFVGKLISGTSADFSANSLIRNAAHANFLKLEGEEVSPRIPLLGRIAAASGTEVN